MYRIVLNLLFHRSKVPKEGLVSLDLRQQIGGRHNTSPDLHGDVARAVEAVAKAMLDPVGGSVAPVPVAMACVAKWAEERELMLVDGVCDDIVHLFIVRKSFCVSNTQYVLRTSYI